MRWVYSIVFIVSLISAANAQEASFAAQMRDVNAKVSLPARQAIIADALANFQAMARKEARCIPTSVEIEAATPATAVRIATQGIQSGQLKNAWTAYGRAQGCKGAPRTRFIILLMANDEVRVRPINQGESIASASLMRDTSAGAAIAALSAIKAINPECDGTGMTMLGTTVVSRSPDLSPDFYGVRYRGSWAENWTFQVCGHSAEVPVSFTADGSGGAYSNIKSAEIKVLK